MRLLVRLGINAIALWAAIEIVPGLEYTGDGLSLLIIALIFGVVNALVRPILVLLTCPLIVLTLGIFVLIINTLLFSITVWLAGPEVLDLGLSSAGFWPTFFGAVIISLVSGAINLLVRDVEESENRPEETRWS
jgi:putative membrane protein